MSSGLYSLQASLDKLKSIDSDLRFMGFNDLNAALSNPDTARLLEADPKFGTTIFHAVLNKLDDPVSEVQNQAVKCLEPLVKAICDDEFPMILKALVDRNHQKSSQSSHQIQQTPEERTSISNLALRTVVLNVRARPAVASAITKIVLTFLLSTANDPATRTIDAMDVLIDIFKRFSGALSEQQVASSASLLSEIISDSRGLFRKRAVIALGILSKQFDDNQWEDLVGFIENGVNSHKNDHEYTKTLIFLCGTLAKANGAKFRQALPKLIPLIISSLQLESLNNEALAETMEDGDGIDGEISEYFELRESVLTALDSIVSADLGTRAIEPYIDEICSICLTFLSYDPNHIADASELEDIEKSIETFSTSPKVDDVHMNSSEVDDENWDEEDQDLQDDYGVSEDELVADDDDQSWRLRWASAKLCGTIVRNVPTSCSKIFSALLRPLIVQLAKEEELTIVGQLIATIHDFYEATGKRTAGTKSKRRRLSDASMMVLDTDPSHIAAIQSTTLINTAAFRISKTRFQETNTTLVGKFLTDILKCIVITLGSDLTGEDRSHIIELIISLKNPAPLMNEILGLVEVIFTEGDDGNHGDLVSVIVQGITSSHYKTANQALIVVWNILSARPAVFDYKEREAVYTAALERANSNVLDVDARGTALWIVGSIIGDMKFTHEYPIEGGLAVMKQCLDNDPLRMKAIMAVERVVSCGAVVFAENSDDSIPNSWYQEVIMKLISFLARNHKNLRYLSLQTMDRILSSAPHSKSVAQVTSLPGITEAFCETGSRSVLEEGLSGDMALLDASLDILSKLAPVDGTFQFGLRVLETTKRAVINQISGPLVKVFQNYLVGSQDTGCYEEVILKRNDDNSETVAKIAAVIISRTGTRSIIEQCENEIINHTGEGSQLLWNLQLIGDLVEHDNVGVNTKTLLNAMYQIFEKPTQKPKREGDDSDSTAALSSTSAAIQMEAAAAAGRLIVKSTDFTVFLEDLSNRISLNVRGSHRVLYLYLVALREVLLENSKGIHTQGERPVEDGLWTILFAIDSSDDNVKTAISECAGQLALLRPSKFLPLLLDKLRSSDSFVRQTVISTIRYTLGSQSSLLADHTEYDDLLRPVVAEFLRSIEDPDRGVRHVALQTLLSAIHNKQVLLWGDDDYYDGNGTDQLGQLLPLLFAETQVIPSLIRTVQMGPFKHRVDDGLDLRKTAFEILFTLASRAPSDLLSAPITENGRTPVEDMVDCALTGLSDDHDIKILSLVLLSTLVKVCPSLVLGTGRLAEITKKFSELLQTKVKENAIKQEFERSGEVRRNLSLTAGVISSVLVDVPQQMNEISTEGDLTNEHSSRPGMVSEVEVSQWLEFAQTIRKEVPPTTQDV